MMTLFTAFVLIAAFASVIFTTLMTSLTAMAGKLAFAAAITLLLISVIVSMVRGRLRA